MCFKKSRYQRELPEWRGRIKKKIDFLRKDLALIKNFRKGMKNTGDQTKVELIFKRNGKDLTQTDELENE